MREGRKKEEGRKVEMNWLPFFRRQGCKHSLNYPYHPSTNPRHHRKIRFGRTLRNIQTRGFLGRNPLYWSRWIPAIFHLEFWYKNSNGQIRLFHCVRRLLSKNTHNIPADVFDKHPTKFFKLLLRKKKEEVQEGRRRRGGREGGEGGERGREGGRGGRGGGGGKC